MIPSVLPLARLAEVNDRLFVNALDGVTDEQGQGRPSGHTNSITFVAVHVVDARHFLTKMLGSEHANPFGEMLKDVQSIEQFVHPPPLSDVRRAWQSVVAGLAVHLEALTEEEARAPAPNAFPVGDNSVLGATAFLMQHEAYHIGQLALIRKYWGLPAMTYE